MGCKVSLSALHPSGRDDINFPLSVPALLLATAARRLRARELESLAVVRLTKAKAMQQATVIVSFLGHYYVTRVSEQISVTRPPPLLHRHLYRLLLRAISDSDLESSFAYPGFRLRQGPEEWSPQVQGPGARPAAC